MNRSPGFPFNGAMAAAPTVEEQLRAQVQEARQVAEDIREKHNAMVAKLTAEPLVIVTVVHVIRPGRAIITGGRPLEINVPEGAKVGSQLRALPKEENGFTLLPEPVLFGNVGTVVAVVGSSACVRRESSELLLPVRDGLDLEPGDRVAMCPSGAVVLKKLPPIDAAPDLGTVASQRVAWEGIVGQDEAVEQLREAVEYPALHPELYAAHGQKPSKGAMLYGPPGTGKTMLGKALATSLGDDTSGFIYVKSTEVMTKYQGESGQRVRALFKRGRDYQAQTGRRAVLFIDEADALLPVRDGGGAQIGGVEDMVPVFLNEMDGLDDLGPFVLLATNRPDRIDPAVLRDGRCSIKVHVKRPDYPSTASIFKLALQGRRGNVGQLSLHGTDEVFSDRHILLELTYRDVRQLEYVRLRDLVSGAMIEGIAQKAAAAAIKRDRMSGKLSEITLDDMTAAVKLTLREQAKLNHMSVIREISKPFGRGPEKVRPVIDG